MISEWQTPGNALDRHPFMRALREKQRWAAEFPEISAAWDEAIAEEHRRESEATRALREARLGVVVAERLDRVGVPQRCIQVLDAELKSTPAFVAAQEFVWAQESFLLLLGSAGAGKSVAAASVLKHQVKSMLERDWACGSDAVMRRVCFVRAAEAARTAASDYSDDDRRRFADWCSVRWLVLDDLGTERAWDGWLSRLDELIDQRYGDKLKTIITTNLNGQTFKARYGERIADRIRDDGCIVSAGQLSLRKPAVPR